MNLIHDDAFEICKEGSGVIGGNEQGQLFRRGEQNVRRVTPLALSHMGGRVAGAGLYPNGQVHILDRRHQIALDIHGQRFQGRNIQGVQCWNAGIVGALLLLQLDQAGEKPRQRLASTRRRDQQGAIPGQALPASEPADASVASSRGSETRSRMALAIQTGT